MELRVAIKWPNDLTIALLLFIALVQLLSTIHLMKISPTFYLLYCFGLLGLISALCWKSGMEAKLKKLKNITFIVLRVLSTSCTLKSDFLRMSRIGRQSRNIDFSFIWPKHTFGWTYSSKNSFKFQWFILRPKFKKVRNLHIMAVFAAKMFQISHFFTKTVGA